MDDWYIPFTDPWSLKFIFDGIKLVGKYTNGPWNPLGFASKFDIHPPKCLNFEGFFLGGCCGIEKQINLILFLSLHPSFCLRLHLSTGC